MLVVLGHTSAQYIPDDTVDVPGFGFAYLCNILAFSGVALFVMLSGALLLSGHAGESVTGLIRRRVLKYLGLYYLVKTLYRMFELRGAGFAGGYEGIRDELVLHVLMKTGHYHLWYLPMYIALLLLTPMLREAVKNRSATRLYLVLFFIFAIIRPTLGMFEFPFKYTLLDTLSNHSSEYFLGYLGYYLLGYHIYTYGRDLPRSVWPAAFLGALMSIAVSYNRGLYLCRLGDRYEGGFSTPFTLAAFLFTVAVTGCVMYMPKEGMLRIAGVPGRVLELLSGASLYIYLIHPAILELWMEYCPGLVPRTPVPGVAVLFAQVFALSAAASVILRRCLRFIPGTHK